jgi:Holliday junction resolvase RusA-like endonuclease
MMRLLTLGSKPLACGRPRVSKNGGVWKAKQKEHDALKVEIAGVWEPFRMIEGGVCVTVDLFFQTPQTFKKEMYASDVYFLLGEFYTPEGKIYPKYTRPDVDNLLKSYLDAMTGIVWKDDGCVWGASCRKWYRDRVGVEIRVEWGGTCRG